MTIILSEKTLTRMRLVTTLLLCIFSITQIYTQTIADPTDILPRREMRGIWVASVNNIDWPSSPGLSTEALKRETNAIISRAKSMGLNTIFLQVRPSSDVIYPSDIEPFTSYLTGVNQRPVEYDPLQYWLEQTHLNGLELHAWINPFRVTPKAEYPCADSHISKTHHEWTITYADKQYLNPGLPEARQYILDVIKEIVTKYDIDGIHFDDYFYPYPVQGETFNDSETFAHNNPLGMSLEDWRRNNVNLMIDSVAAATKAIRPNVKFGVSPFGVWRNKNVDPRGSETKAGITDYDILYADVLSWVDNGWLDYIVPQIYWESGNKAADFDKLCTWWAENCKEKTQIYVGHAVFKVNSYGKSWENPNEIPSQIEKVREHNDLDGSVFFSYRQFNRDILGLEDVMRSKLFSYPTLPPRTPCYDNTLRGITIKDLYRKDNKIIWDVEIGDTEPRFYIVIRYPKGKRNERQIFDIVGTNSITLTPNTPKKQKYVFCVMPVDKYGRVYAESEKLAIKY